MVGHLGLFRPEVLPLMQSRRDRQPVYVFEKRGGCDPCQLY